MTISGPWPPLPPVGADPPWGLPPFSFGPEDPNVSTQDLVTRQMCGAVHLDGRFANTVAGELLSVPHRAVWPAWHVDYVLLARHAKFSRERRMLRDLSLCLLMLVLLFGWAVLLLAFVVDRLSFRATLFGAVAIGLVVFGGAYLQVWSFYDELIDIVFEITEQPLISLDRLNAWSGWPPTFVGLVPAVARVMHGFNAWYMKLRHEVRASWRAFQGRSRQDERPTQDGWAYIDSLERSNVVLFDRAMKPFQLAGVPLDTFTITVDITRYVNGTAGTPALSATDLHRKLLKEVPDGSLPLVRADSLLVASGMQPKELKLFPRWRRGEPDPVNDQLLAPAEAAEPEPGAPPFDEPMTGAVDEDPAVAPASSTDPGAGAATVAQLIGEDYDPDEPVVAGPGGDPDPRSRAGERVNPDGWYLEHPDSWVDDAMIAEALEGPPEGARVYAYFQKYSWRGHVVVCAAVRVYRALNTLYIEFDAHALPPLSDGFINMYNLPEGARNRRMALGRTVMARTPGLLFQSLRAMFGIYFTPSGRMTVIRELQAQLEDEARIDYGSRINLRLAAGNVDALWRFPYVDELDYARVFRDRTLDVIEGYLNGYGVPLTGFKRQRKDLRRRTRNYDVDEEP